MSVRLRYAPSPTGDLHLGSLRTVIFDYLFAKQHDGILIMRIEDTDQARTIPGSVERQLEALRWMGIELDEGVVLDANGAVTEKGEFGPYYQSKRLPLYAEKAQWLLENGHAYRCFCSSERLEQMRAEQQANHLPPKYDQTCRKLTREESDHRAANEPFVIRHAIPVGQTVKIQDIIRGEVSFLSDDLDDYVLLKSDGFPTYQLANAVDDPAMQITHVLRGEEWLPSLPKNILLYQAFGVQPPQFAHLPVILGPDGKHKLSKRDGHVSVMEYAEAGYLPEALFNILAFIGWSPGTEEEFFTLEQLIERFTLDKVQKAPAVFNFERLDYVNGWYIRQLPVEVVAEKMLPFLEKAGITVEDKAYLEKIAGVLQERLKHFDESAELSRFFFERPQVNDELRALLVPKKADPETTRHILTGITAFLEEQTDWSQEGLEASLRAVIEEKGHKTGEVLWPIRAALSGLSASPGAFELLAIFGKEESLTRLRAVL